MAGDDRVDVLVIGAGAAGAAVAWSLPTPASASSAWSRGLGRPATPCRTGRSTGSCTALTDLNAEPERARACPGLPGQRRRVAIRAADVQRGGREHDPLERPLPALPPLRLSRAEPRRRRRRLADRRTPSSSPVFDLNDRMVGVAGVAGDPSQPPRSPRQTPPIPMGALGATMAPGSRSSAGTGGRRTAPSTRRATRPPGPCNYCGPCDLGCPIGAEASTDVTYWPQALRLGVACDTRCRVREITLGPDGRARGASLLRRRRAACASRRRARWSCAANGIGTPRLLLNSRSAPFPERAGEPQRAGRPEPHVPPFATVRGVFDPSRSALTGVPIGSSLISQEFYETDSRAASCAATRSRSRGALRRSPRPGDSSATACPGPRAPPRLRRALRSHDHGRGHRRGSARAAQPGGPRPRSHRRPRRYRRRACPIPLEREHRAHARLTGSHARARRCGRPALARSRRNPLTAPGGWHLMGTSRMGRDPTTSVIDAEGALSRRARTSSSWTAARW